MSCCQSGSRVNVQHAYRVQDASIYNIDILPGLRLMKLALYPSATTNFPVEPFAAFAGDQSVAKSEGASNCRDFLYALLYVGNLSSTTSFMLECRGLSYFSTGLGDSKRVETIILDFPHWGPLKVS